MGSAWETPVPNGRIERNRPAVENQLPISGAQRRHDLLAAAAGAFVHSCRVSDRHVNLSLVDRVGDEFHEFVRERLRRFHCWALPAWPAAAAGTSSFRSILPPIV